MPKLYADATPRFARQLSLDILVACWVIGWIWVGTVVHDGVMALADPGQQIADSATDLAGSLSEAGDFLGGVPVVGDGVSAPFEGAADASTSLAGAGATGVETIERLAFWLGLTIALLPILYVVGRYLPGRIRFVRDASAGSVLLAGDVGLEVFAWRAVSNQPLHALVRVTTDPVGALRRGDQDTIARLAALELRQAGLVAPATSGTVGP